jgi:hypothetical protein
MFMFHLSNTNNVNRFKMSHLNNIPDANIKKNYKINPSKRRAKEAERRRLFNLKGENKVEIKELTRNNIELKRELEEI